MATQVAFQPTREVKRRLLALMLESRHGDLREESLNRQGRGHFHVSGRGHEAFAAVGLQLEQDDYLAPYYRDRGLVLARGLKTKAIALEYFAKRESSSRGRMMAAHYSDRALNIWSVPTPTASQLLPACGLAWGLQLDGKRAAVVTCVGDAATRQGDFYEAVCFAQERRLPVLFLVEDNAYGISTPTRKTNPLALGVLDPGQWHVLDAWDVVEMYRTAQAALGQIRAGHGPVLVWARTERLSSHTSTDDHTLYRSREELAAMEQHDPVLILQRQMIAAGELTREEFARLDKETKERVRGDYEEAERAADPCADELETGVRAPFPVLEGELFPAGTYRMGDLVNRTLRAGLAADPRRIVFGEDVEDPKGGVFRLTQKLTGEFPGRVVNSPLAESTILGVACGLAAYGKRPVFEVQFVDFIYTGFNQLVSNLATLRWRTNGRWTCPAVIYAPCGAYLPGGGLWHSQANESMFAHHPGLTVVVPGTAEDAAGLLWTAMHAEDPVLFLIPKHLLWAERPVGVPVRPVPFGVARRCREGTDVTVVAWGNALEKAEEAVALLDGAVSVELIDLRSIEPWDREGVEASVCKTGRLVVVQEDTENCSAGQMIVSHLAGRPDVWSRLATPPVLVSKPNVMIGYNPIYEYAALPDAARVVAAIRRVLELPAEPVLPRPPAGATEASPAPSALHDALAFSTVPGTDDIIVKVPIMGEGIRSARVVTLLRQPGDAVSADDPLCELETDKAVYPIEAAFSGVFKHWKVRVGDTVAIGQEIALVTGDAAGLAAVRSAALGAGSPARRSEAVPASAGPEARVSVPVAAGDLPPPGALCPPALSPAITKRLGGVVPVNLLVDVRWAAVRAARDAAKKRLGAAAPSPSAMMAWCVVRVMEKHAGFRRIVGRDGLVYAQTDFELGVAVALPGDRLATAAVPAANRLAWAEFVDAYGRAIAETRAGRLAELQAPLNISSLGAFGVESATPLVVPPAMSTLFIGAAHERLYNDGGVIYPVEVITLSLTFDHRVVNGAGAAAFMADLKQQLETFQLPE